MKTFFSPTQRMWSPVRYNSATKQEFVRLKQASRSWHAHLTTCLKTLGFQQCLADACVFPLVEEGRVGIIAVVHVDDIFAVGLKSGCDVF